VSKDSVHALLGHPGDACLRQAVPLHTTSERQRNPNPRTIVPADPGMIHAFDASAGANTARWMLAGQWWRSATGSGLASQWSCWARSASSRDRHDVFEKSRFGDTFP
jgi:hypothetical protein